MNSGNRRGRGHERRDGRRNGRGGGSNRRNNPSRINYGDYPNPFDFVPFKGEPNLFLPSKLEAGNLLSGYITLKLAAKTPVHITGNVHAANGRITKSTFYRQDGGPCIPGSSIRGMLRSFIEALTNGWVSQVQKEEYKKKKGERYRGYKVFDDAIPPLYRPFARKEEEAKDQEPDSNAEDSPSETEGIDIATYLFGYVLSEKSEEESAWRSRVSFEDAYFNEESITKYSLPDIQGTAFMGSPNPRKSSWWYFEPERKPKGFEGAKYRGRKFYYHQVPQSAIDLYKYRKGEDSEEQSWPRHKDDERRNPRYPFPIECLDNNKQTGPFRVYFERVPETLIGFLALCLCPKHLRHSLGYGKPYGYGAVEFSVVEARFCKVSVGWPNNLEDYAEIIKKYITGGFEEFIKNDSSPIKEFVDVESLIELETILCCPYPGIPFLYPPFVKGYFKQPINWSDAFLSKSSSQIIDELASKKKTMDFRHFQDNSEAYNKIKKRREEVEKRYK